MNILDTYRAILKNPLEENPNLIEDDYQRIIPENFSGGWYIPKQVVLTKKGREIKDSKLLSAVNLLATIAEKKLNTK